jgi:hypothetical protein
MCFVWISEQTAIISMHSINWLVFITDPGCVYCAVSTEFLDTIEMNFTSLWSCHGSGGHSPASDQKSPFRSRPAHVRFVVERVALGQVFQQVLWFALSVSFHRYSSVYSSGGSMFWSQISREHCGWIRSSYWKILSPMTLIIIIIIIVHYSPKLKEVVFWKWK